MTSLSATIQDVFNEPSCAKNANKSAAEKKKGCTKQLLPGGAAGGCAFDGAKIALQPFTDVAHLVHGPIACEGNSWDNRGAKSSGFRRGGGTPPWQIAYCPRSAGRARRPRRAVSSVCRRLARLTGGRLHLCHLSSAGSVDMVRRAKAEGLRVTAEVTPHHLVFADEDLVTYDTNLKVHPPLRSVEDRDALWAGLADGTIDAVATDHAPHAVEEKEAEFDQSPPGTIGLETALAAVMTHGVATARITLSRAIEALSAAPARLLGATGHGGPIEAGRMANLVVFDPAAEWVVEAPFVSKSRNSAFLGHRLTGRVVHTLYRGEPVVANGKAQR